ncbi:hypothetical protein [Salinibacillus xinjiangensis]|uniref:Uncharacterized protein n=1 Tax=Salinibacillus xinjiangensis TaxID=1229268 RepID=A0A6G1XAM4_9BACI|nr:hypothetical protein [Salinibacillus xinjiangensis]MRG88063.1 hypothetical protein [Salinibacillus xinjiangensis]
MSWYLKSLIGALIGGATAGGWLVVDLLLPDPIGDYLLFLLMGIANAGIGWQVGRVVGKRRERERASVLESSANGKNSRLREDL